MQATDGPTNGATQPQSGDPCPGCDGGHLVVYAGHTRGKLHVRYLECWQCKRKPPENKIVVDASGVRKRQPRKKCPNNVNSPVVTSKNELIIQT